MIDLLPFLQGRQLLSLPVCFPAHQASSEKGSPLKEKNLLTKETRGPWLAHLSDIATADMQLLCNIFPILSSQLMTGSSFKQFLVLKKNTWA